jgi:alkanesulfonate monooxygenase SsuD/methylene tetrahydromethanopterin reductase-like flavin-dependent oxidoreductase (luciferase family)
MRFGYFHDFDEQLPLGPQIDELVELGELAATAGFESLWTGENQPQEESCLLPSPLLVLASVARQVSLRLGTGIALGPLWQPHRLAADSAVLDQLSDGRFTLGLGVGAPDIWNRFGVPKEDVGPAFDELLAYLPRVWRGEADVGGEHAPVDGPFWPLPVQEGGIPIWVAGRIKRSARRAALHGEALYFSTPVRLEEIERLGALYREELAALGKDPAQGRVAANRIFVVVESEEDVARVAEPYASNVLRTYAGLGALRTPDEVRRSPDENLFELFGEGIYFAGTPDTVADTIARYAESGVTDLNFRVRGGRLPLEHARRSLELFRDDVQPRLAGISEAVRSA